MWREATSAYGSWPYVESAVCVLLSFCSVFLEFVRLVSSVFPLLVPSRFWYLLSLCHHNFYMSVVSYTGWFIVLFPVFTSIFTLIGFPCFSFIPFCLIVPTCSPSLVSQMCIYSPVPCVCAPRFWSHLHLVTCVVLIFSTNRAESLALLLHNCCSAALCCHSPPPLMFRTRIHPLQLPPSRCGLRCLFL